MVKINENSKFAIFNTKKPQMNDDFLIKNVSKFESEVMVKIKENSKFIISNTSKNS